MSSKAKKQQKVQLDKVLGLTLTSTSGLCTSEATGLVAYPAGCVVVLFNPRRNKQSFLINQSKKAITAVAFSPDGKFLVTGECGHLPNVRIWDVSERIQVAEFAGHKFAINCVAFSPNNKYVVSIGSQHDMIVNVWNWRTSTKVASNKVACQVKALAFADSGSYFVTVGMRHVKFWYLDYNKDAKTVETVPLLGRSAILGEQRNNNFCDVACGRGQMADSTYTITQSGLLCEFNSKRLLDKWVELRTSTAQCLSVGVDAIFCGCSDGIVRVFSPFTLHFIATLPRPHYLGVDVAAGLSPSHMIHPPEKAKYPDTMAVVFNSKLALVTAVYNDHSLYVWDVANVKKVGKVWSSLYHSSCIWGVEVYPVVGKSMLPPGTFITCSSDDTIRFWNLEMHMSNETDYKRNIYSSELIKVLYMDKDLQFLTDKEWSPGSNKSGELDSVDGKNGVRSLRVSANGQQLASGDRSGNIRVHELQHMEEMCKIEAHDAEVLYLEYSKNTTGDRLLASASRDRLIHVFDVDEGYAFQQTLDDHSSSITAVRFTQSQNELKMFSCSADKSIIFRTAHYLPDLQFVRNHHVVGKTNMYDMDVDPTCKQIATACHDRNIRVYDVATGKQKKCFKGALGEDGALIKISLDPSGLYVSTSCSDKNISLFDFFSGECMATSQGHSELVTGLRFTSDCKHLISVSGDGCIFVWKINPDFVRNMQIRLAQLGRAYNRPPSQPENRRTTFLSIPNTIMSETEPGSDDSSDLEEKRNISKESFSVPSKIPESSEESLEYRFSMGQVPAWAKKQISSEQVPEKLNSSDSSRYQPRGRWGQQASDAVKVKSIWDEQEDPSLSRNQFRSVTPGVSPIPPAPGSVLKRRETISGTPTRSRHLSSESTDADDEAVMNAKNRQMLRTPNRRRISDTNAPTSKYGDILSGNLQASKFTAKSLMNLSNIGKKTIDQTITMAELSNLAKSLQDLSNLNLEDLEKDDSQEPIVFQLPNEDESGETSFKVIEISPAVLREALRQQKLHGAPLAAQEDTRIDTDSFSEEDRFTDDNSSVITTVSVPSTPSKVNKQFFGTHLEKEHMDKEKYIKSGYSDLSLSKEKFGNSVESVEKAVDGSSDHRLSISARFLQKSYNGNAMKVGPGGSGDRPYSPKTTVSDTTLQKRTEELGKAMEATRKRLESLGWKGSRGKLSADTNISGDYERETPSPPTKDTPSESELLLQRAKSLPDVSAIGSRRRVLPPTPSDSNQSTAETRTSRMKRSSSQQDVNKPARSPSFTGPSRSGGVPSYAQSTSSSQAKIAKSRSITNLADSSQETEPKKQSRSQQRYKRLSFMTAKSTPNLASDVDKKTVGVDDQRAKEEVSVTVTRRASVSASAVEGKSRQERVAEMLNKQPPVEIRADTMSRVTENVSITTKRPPMVPPRKKAVPGERSPLELPVKDTSPSPVRKVDIAGSATYSASPILTGKTPDKKQRHHEMSPLSEKDLTAEICIEQLQNATQNAVCMYDKVVQSDALKKEEKLDKLRRLALSFQQTQDVIARCASKHLDNISLTELNALQDSLAKRASDPDTSAVMLQQYNSLLFNLRVHKMQSSPASDV